MITRSLVRKLAMIYLIIIYGDIIIELINTYFPYFISKVPYKNDIMYLIYYTYMFIIFLIIPWKFRKYLENLFFYYLYSSILYFFKFSFVFIVLYCVTSYLALSNQYLYSIYSFFEIYIVYFMIVFVILFPVSNLFDKEQIIRIEFKMLNNNLENYKERQKWMRKIFKKLTKRLERGNIKVSYDNLIHNFNIKLMSSNNVNKYINDIEKWMINEKTDTDFFYSLKQIIPEEDIKSIEKISYRNIIFRMFEPEYFKYFWIPFMLILVYYFKPDIFDKIFDKLSLNIFQ